MKVVHLNTRDLMGGAARSAYRLHQGLQSIGWSSTMFVMEKTCPDQTIVRFERPHGLIARLRSRIRREVIARDFSQYRASRPLGYEMFSDDRSRFQRPMVDQIPRCDVVNLHWVAGMLDYTSFFPLMTARRPVVWTLHDMNAFTGGCHYDDGCGRFTRSCGLCPQLGSNQRAGFVSSSVGTQGTGDRDSKNRDISELSPPVGGLRKKPVKAHYCRESR